MGVLVKYVIEGGGMVSVARLIAATILTVMTCPAVAQSNAGSIYGFRGGPTYPASTPESRICNEHVGAKPEEISAMRTECERLGWKWQGRLNWTAFAQEKQREIDVKFTPLSYAEQVISWNRQFEQIASRLGLNEQMSAQAQKTALNWVHLGPCKGSDGDSSSAAIVVGADGSNDFQIAILAMITILLREDLGRKPTDHVCQFSREMTGK